MAIIPSKLTPQQQADRLTYLQTVKQERFKYSTGISSLPVGVGWSNVAPAIPSLDPELVLKIMVEQPDYWFDSQWRNRDSERRDKAKWAYFEEPHGNPSTINAYGNVKAPYPATSTLNHIPALANDRSFAAQRLSGANPLVIRKVTVSEMDGQEWTNKIAIKDSHLPKQSSPLKTLARENRLYICDYHHLADFAGPGETVNTGPLVWQTKYLSAPIALFRWVGPFSDSGELLPLAIQFRRNSAAPVFTPADSQSPTHPWNWYLAKAAVQVADAHAHEWDSHLVRTHIILTPFAVSSERHLHDEHPVLILLRPHLRYLLAINSRTDELVGKGEYGDKLLAPTFERKQELLLHNYKKFDFAKMADPDTEFKLRLMDAQSAPIPYPIRDDGLPVHGAIRTYVEAYLRLYYDNDSEVATDTELQNFVAELKHNNYGKLGSLTANGEPVDRIHRLAALLTAVVWTSGPLHAAVNFSQWGYMADPRNMPFAGYDLPPSGPMVAPDDPVHFMPRYEMAKIQAALMYNLGTWRMDMLGFYRGKDFLDPNALKVIADFQCALARVGADTFARDELRTFNYPYLIPWNIPNSTNI